MNHTTGARKGSLFVSAEHGQASPMTHLPNRFHASKETNLNFCIGARFSSRVCPLAQTNLKYNECKIDNSRIAKTWHSSLDWIVRQVIKVFSTFMRPTESKKCNRSTCKVMHSQRSLNKRICNQHNKLKV